MDLCPFGKKFVSYYKIYYIAYFAIRAQRNGIDGGCHNLLRPGFVQVHPIIYLGRPYNRASTHGGQQFVMHPSIRLVN